MNPILVESEDPSRGPDLWFTPPDGPGPLIFISQEKGGPTLRFSHNANADLAESRGGTAEVRAYAEALLRACDYFDTMRRRNTKLMWVARRGRIAIPRP